MAEFGIAQSVFAEELAKLQSVIVKKGSIPILGFIRIEAIDQKLILTATNLEETIYSIISSNQLAVTVPGLMCVPAKRTLEAVKLMPAGPIKVTSDTNGWIKILAPGSSQRIPGGVLSQFPETPDYNHISWIELPAKQFKALLQVTRFSITTNEALYNLRGAKLEIDSNGSRIITTDGTRLSLASSNFLSTDNLDILIPVEAVDELLNLMPDNLETFSVGLSNQLFFKLADRIVCSRLLTSKFVSYQMPFANLGQYQHFTNFPANDLIKPIKRAMQAADEKDKGITFAFNGAGNLAISAASAELGESFESLSSDYNGPAIKIYFNGVLLLEFLETVGTSVVRFEVKDNISQVYLTANYKDVTAYYCIMPLRPPEA